MGLQTAPLPQTPYIACGKDKKIENWNFIVAVFKMFPSPTTHSAFLQLHFVCVCVGGGGVGVLSLSKGFCEILNLCAPEEADPRAYARRT